MKGSQGRVPCVFRLLKTTLGPDGSVQEPKAGADEEKDKSAGSGKPSLLKRCMNVFRRNKDKGGSEEAVGAGAGASTTAGRKQGVK